MPKGQGRSATSKGFYFLQAMTEEQVQTAKTEATAQVEEGVEEMSEEDLEGVAGGVWNYTAQQNVGMHTYADGKA